VNLIGRVDELDGVREHLKVKLLQETYIGMGRSAMAVMQKMPTSKGCICPTARPTS